MSAERIALPAGSGLDLKRFTLHEDDGHVWILWRRRWWRVVVIPREDWPRQGRRPER